MKPGAGGKRSLRARLAWHVLVPLVLTWSLGTVAVMAVAAHFVGEAFDRSLLDDAYALASQVRNAQGEVVLSLNPREVATLLYDQSEAQYFAVVTPGGRVVAGQAALAAVAERPGFGQLKLEGQALRTVTVQRIEPLAFTVVMGQTTSSRTALLQRVLAFSVLPQAVLLVLLALWLRRRIQADVQPLSRLAQAIGERHADDLEPLPPAITQAASTRDVERIGVAVDALLGRLKGSVDAQREFAGTVAHELRTPLAAIRAHAALGLAQAEPAAWREHLAGVTQAEQRASRMVDQLLALARAAEAGAALNRQSLALNEVVRELVLSFLSRADAMGVDLGAEGLDDENLEVTTDRALLEGILTNLLDNALRYGRGHPARVTVRLTREGGEAVLAVSDNGPGLDPNASVADRWVQGERGRRLGEGAGLGLAIVSRYAALLGGTLRLEPVTGGPGLCARLGLPLARTVVPGPQKAQ